MTTYNEYPEIRQFVNDWAIKATEWVLNIQNEYKEKKASDYFKNIAKENNNTNPKYKTTSTQEMFYWFSSKGISDQVRQLIMLYTEEGIKKFYQEDSKVKYDKFIATVEKKSGKILEAELSVGNNGELNGTVKGEIATVTVKTVSAGGHNIQCFHYRVLVKVSK